jgi:acetolactate synthase-1/3 small subunit
MKHTISVLVENKFGVLARVAGLFSARGYNIDSLTVSETEDPATSRMTVVVNAEDEKILEQIKKQLNKLIDVITVTDFTKKSYFEREVVFVKIVTDPKDAKKMTLLKKLIRSSGACVVEQGKAVWIIELVEDTEHVGGFLNALKDFKISELVRSGRIAISK